MAALKTSPSSPKPLTYASSGVDIDQKDAFTESLDSMLRKTYTDRVIPNPGGFAGLFRLDYKQRLFARNYKDPVLVACCDGVGTKVLLATEMQTFDTVGIDLVAMNVNDLIVQGAEPLFFLDYIATPVIDKKFLSDIVKGIAEGCKRSGCALIGGETANMPDIYKKGDFDLAGFCVGVAELKKIQKPTRVKHGDVILGLASDGIHSNGYTLVRNVVKQAGLDLHRVYEELVPNTEARRRGGKKKASGKKGSAPTSDFPLPTLGQVLLTPTRLYADPIVRLQRGYHVKNVISGMAHITGSGIPGNLCRALPSNLDAVVDRAAWPRPAVFSFLQDKGNIPEEEMWRIFNMGIGYCVIVKKSFADSVAERLTKLGETVYTIGTVQKNGKGEVRWK
ncbi:MAG TPA: phosphoribosylformylglycinamidine cyclo-ligase [Phycisphaerales bacterium]|nr:phosphoribosylformylglycinamidine cyclo-ligase [Phycisphaerales bacterium]